jgi:tetratricopeptide (TPR) repeat protein
VWLLVAHCLHRLSRANGDARRIIAENCASAIGDLASTVSPDTPEEAAMLAELARLRNGLAAIDGERGATEVVAASRVLADQMAEAGAHWLAMSTLGHVRRAAAAAAVRELGLAMADQAWVARSLGDLDTADDLYAGVGAMGAKHGEPELQARALLGQGVTARVRGNYPKARKYLRQGLTCAESAGLHDLAAVGHQGLLIAAGTAGDYPTALVHGWAAFELAAGSPVRQAEILINLSQATLDAGQPRAARSGFLASMSRTDELRFRLPCLGGAAVASAALGDTSMLETLARASDESVSANGFPFESASVLRSLFEAFAAVGESARAEDYRLRARALARKNGFFEIVLATERREVREAVEARAMPSLTPESLTVIHSLEAMSTEPLAATL